MCRALAVSYGGYHSWPGQTLGVYQVENDGLLLPIRELRVKDRRSYGITRIKAALRFDGVPWGKDRWIEAKKSIIR
jgi:hypothetical protein